MSVWPATVAAAVVARRVALQLAVNLLSDPKVWEKIIAYLSEHAPAWVDAAKRMMKWHDQAMRESEDYRRRWQDVADMVKDEKPFQPQLIADLIVAGATAIPAVKPPIAL